MAHVDGSDDLGLLSQNVHQVPNIAKKFVYVIARPHVPQGAVVSGAIISVICFKQLLICTSAAFCNCMFVLGFCQMPTAAWGPAQIQMI